MAVLERAEAAVGVDREGLVAGLALAATVFLATSPAAGQVCNVVGFVYPTFRSTAAIRAGAGGEEATQWLVYWLVFAGLSLVDAHEEAVLRWFPVYWAAKLALLVYLWLPATRGAHRLYKNHLGPPAEHLATAVEDSINLLIS